MRAIIYYISLSFLLLCGGNYGYAHSILDASNTSFSLKLQKKQHFKHKDSTHHSKIIVSSDIDLDEEFHLENEFDYGGSNALSTNNQFSQNNWYITFTESFLFKTIATNNSFFEPFYGQYNPIYLKIGALKI